MALSITSNYNGDVIQEIARLAFLGNQTVEGGHIYVSENIKKERSIPRMVTDNLIQDFSAQPITAGTFTVDELQLIPDKYLLYVEYNPDDFRDFWEFGQPTGEFVFSELSPDVQVAMMDEILNGSGGVNVHMGKNIWQGDKSSGTAPDNKFDGLAVKAAANADVIDVTGTTISAANAIAEIEKVYVAAPSELKENPNGKIFMSTDAWYFYEQAVIALANKGPAPTDELPRRYKGKQIVALEGIPTNDMFYTVGDKSTGSNIWLGLSAVNDATTIKEGPVNNTGDNHFFKMKVAADTQIKWGQRMVYYT